MDHTPDHTEALLLTDHLRDLTIKDSTNNDDDITFQSSTDDMQQSLPLWNRESVSQSATARRRRRFVNDVITYTKYRHTHTYIYIYIYM